MILNGLNLKIWVDTYPIQNRVDARWGTVGADFDLVFGSLGLQFCDVQNARSSSSTTCTTSAPIFALATPDLNWSMHPTLAVAMTSGCTL